MADEYDPLFGFGKGRAPNRQEYDPFFGFGPGVVEDAPNNLEQFLGEAVQKVPVLQGILNTLGQPGSAVSNVFDAAVLGVQGKGDVALDRLASAGKNLGEFARGIASGATLGMLDIPHVADADDIRMFSDVLESAGVGRLGVADLPLIGKVSGRGTLGLIGDIFTDPLRFGRIGSLTKAGQIAKQTGRGAIPLRELISDTGKVGSLLELQARKGHRALVGFRAPFTDTVVPLVRGARALRAVDRVRSYAAKTDIGKMFGVKGMGLAEALAEKGGVRGARLGFKFAEDAEKWWLGKVEEAKAKGIPSEDYIVNEALRGAELGRDAPKLFGADDAVRGQVKRLYQMYRAQGESRRVAMRAAKVASLYDVDEVMAPIGAQFAERFQGLLKDELAMGLSISELTDDALYYVTRVLTPEARQLLEKRGKSMAFVKAFREWSAKHGYTKRRATIFEGKSIPELNKWLQQEIPELKGRYFETDPAKIALARSYGLERTATIHDLFSDAVEHFGREKSAFTPDADVVAAGDIAGKLGLRFTRPQGRFGGRADTALAKFKGHVVPKAVADELLRVVDRWRSPQAAKDMIGLFDRATRMWKTGVTVFFPQFHVRNLASAMWANYLADLHNPAMYGKALEVFKDLKRGGNHLWKVGGEDITTKELWRIMESNKAVRSGFLRESQLPLFERRGKRTALRKVTDFAEDWPRVALFLDRLEKGFSLDDATMAVKRFHFNYQDLSPTEKSIMRRAVPFYTWCVPDDCEILTRDGWKFVDDLQVGEDVYSMDHEDGTAEWVSCDEIATFPYDGVLMSLNSTHEDFLFTPDHRWPTVDHKGERKIRRGHELRTNLTIPRVSVPKPTSESIASRREAALIGWIVTDGYMRRRGGHTEMLIYQSPGKYLDEIVDLVGEDGSIGKPHPDSGVVPVRITGELRARLAKLVNDKAQMPGFVTRLGRDEAEACLTAMMHAEGASTDTFDFFAQNHGPVLDAFQILCQMTERVAQINARGCYIGRSGRNLKVAGKVGTRWYSGRVWCPVTKHGTWLMRRHGRIVWTGNTRKNLPLQLESLVTKPGKAAAAKHFQDWLQSDGSDAPVDNAIVPEWVRRRLYGAKTEGENVRLISGVGIGLEDLAQLDQPGQTFLTMLNPIFRGPLEIATKRDFFRDTPVNAADIAPPILKYFAHIPGGKALLDAIDFRPVKGPDGEERFYRANPIILNVMRNAPALGATSRGMQTISGIGESAFQEQAHRPEPVMRFLTGQRYQVLPREQQVRNNLILLTDVMIERLEQLERGGITSSLKNTFYVRRDDLVQQDPRAKEAQMILQKLRELRKIRQSLSETGHIETRRVGLRSGGQ